MHRWDDNGAPSQGWHYRLYGVNSDQKTGEVIHQETETFNRKVLATEWLRRRESKLDQLKARGELVQGTRYTVGELIPWYRNAVRESADWGRRRKADLVWLGRCRISKCLAH